MGLSREARSLPTESQGEVALESNSLLVARNLSKHFGALKAVDDVSFEVAQGQIFSIIGPNGAGKTTLFNVITATYPATSGELLFCGGDILGLRDYSVAELGIGRTFQKIRLFTEMTVFENVLVGLHSGMTAGVWDALLQTRTAKGQEEWARQRALEVLRRVELHEYQEYLASELSLGHQKRLEVARASAGQPKLLLLDEPTAGMNPLEKQGMMSLIRAIRGDGMTIVLVEHDMKVIMGISDWILVLNHGVKIAEGPPEEIRRNDKVIEAYLGRGYSYEPASS